LVVVVVVVVGVVVAEVVIVVVGSRATIGSADGGGKDDEALKLKRQLIQQVRQKNPETATRALEKSPSNAHPVQEVARAKARELCSQQGQMDMNEVMQSEDRGFFRQQQQQQMITQQGPLTAQQVLATVMVPVVRLIDGCPSDCKCGFRAVTHTRSYSCCYKLLQEASCKGALNAKLQEARSSKRSKRSSKR